MNILFVVPPARDLSYEPIVVPPLGLLYVAGMAVRAGYAVTVLDAFAEGLDWESFAKRLDGKQYDIIALGSMTPIFDTVHRAISICRPHTRYIVLGGAHVTANAENILQENPLVDYAIYGEGEESFWELIDALKNERDPQTVPGVITRKGYLIKRDMLRDLDALPFPLRDGQAHERYRYPFFPGRRVATIISSRGCPYHCIFCDKSVFGSRWVSRSAENVLAEIDEVVQKYAAQSIIFYDDLFTLSHDRLAAICEGLIERNYDLTWKAEGRVDLVDEKMLQLMRRAGCTMLAYGVETANPHGLQFLRKKTNPDMIREAFAQTRKAGIRSMGYFILGIPVETWEDALHTIRFASEIRADYAQFSVLSPLKGSELYTVAMENEWYKEVKAGNVSDKDILRPAIVNENWDEKRLADIVRLAHRNFYLRPSYMARTFLREVRNKGVLDIVRSGLRVIRYSLGE